MSVTDEGDEQHRADGEREDAGDMAPEQGDSRDIGAVHQQWWQEEHEHRFGIEFNGREAWHEGERAAADQEGDGVGRPTRPASPCRTKLTISEMKTSSNISVGRI